MKTYIRYAFATLSVFALALFAGNGFFIGQAHAQTADKAINTKGTGAVARSEFKQDVEEGVQEVKNDKDAQNNQHEIDSADKENAGDEHGDVNEIDGENNQDEIDNEIEQEIDQEDAASGHSSNQENGSASPTGNGTSSGVNTGDNN